MRVVTGYKTTLSSSITSTDTTIPVTSVTTVDGHVLVGSDVDNFAFLIIEPGGNNQEIVSVTGISGVTWTGATRGLAFYGSSLASVTTNQKAHQAGSEVVMSDNHQQFDELMDLSSNETVTGVKTYIVSPLVPTGGTGLQAANATDIANAVSGASGTATNLVKGTVLLSSAASVPANPTVLNSEEVSATSVPNKVVRGNSGGQIDASWGGAASTIATLNGGSTVVQNPANATTTPAAAKMPISDSASHVNQWVSQTTDNSLTTGEAIDGSTTPQVVCVKASDGLIYKAKANDVTLLNGYGFVTTNATITTVPYVVTSGVVGGFTSLTKGADYYVTDTAGTISTTPSSTTVFPIGRAISATQIEINFGKKTAYATITHTISSATSTTDSQTVTCGFQPSMIDFTGTLQTTTTSGPTSASTWGMGTFIGTVLKSLFRTKFTTTTGGAYGTFSGSMFTNTLADGVASPSNGVSATNAYATNAITISAISTTGFTSLDTFTYNANAGSGSVSTTCVMNYVIKE